jgi:hypothetical protein
MDRQTGKVATLTASESRVGGTSATFVTDGACAGTPHDPIEVAEKLVADLGDALQLRQRDGTGPHSTTRRPLTPEQELAWQTFWYAIDHPPRPPRLRAWLGRLIREARGGYHH